MKPRALEQPASDQDGLMRPVLIEDQVDREVARHVGLSGLKELAKLNGPVPSIRLPDDSLRIQRRKQRGGAMTSVVMAAPLGLPRLQGQQRLASIQCLDLRLLIDPQDEGLVWRTHIETDNVPDFLDEQRIGRQLERLRAMRLQPERSPNPTDGALAQAGGRRHSTTTPVRGVRRPRLQGPAHNILDVRIGNPPRRAWSGLIQQSIPPLSQEALPPLADRLRRHPLLLRHHVVQLTGRAAQDQSSPLGQGLRRRATSMSFSCTASMSAATRSCAVGSPGRRCARSLHSSVRVSSGEKPAAVRITGRAN